MASGSRGNIVPRSLMIAFILAAIGCRQSISPPGKPPDTALHAPADPPKVPFDVDCTKGGEHWHDYQRNCSQWDREKKGDEVDNAYGEFAWDLFRWLNPDNDQVRWKDWSSRKVISRAGCEPERNLAQFITPPVSADCSKPESAVPSSNPLWDIHGNLVEIEARVDPRTKRQYCGGKNAFAAVAEQEEKAYCSGIKGNTWSSFTGGELEPGLIHIKIAWKTLVDEDCELGRRFILKGTMQFGCQAGQAGMVAMHVAIKGLSGGHNWTWATFSHRDNLAPEHPMFAPCKVGELDCNVCSAAGKATRISQVTPIPKWIDTLNKAHDARYPLYKDYRLLGIQRQVNAWPEEGHRGAITPEVLANEIIEWDRQQTNCIGCHSKATVQSPAGPDKAAWSCCVDGKGDGCKGSARFVRCALESPPGDPIFIADYFWGLKDWYGDFNRYCKDN